MSKRRPKMGNVPGSEAMQSHAWSALHLDRDLARSRHDEEVVFLSVTAKWDGDGWFIILHGQRASLAVVQFCRIASFLSLAALIREKIREGNWQPDKYAKRL